MSSTAGTFDFDRDDEGFVVRHLSRMGKDVLVLLRMAKAVKNRDYSLATPQIATLLGALGYVAMPIDAIPDVIPIAGLSDDAGVVALSLTVLAVEIAAFREWDTAQHSGKYTG